MGWLFVFPRTMTTPPGPGRPPSRRAATAPLRCVRSGVRVAYASSAAAVDARAFRSTQARPAAPRRRQLPSTGRATRHHCCLGARLGAPHSASRCAGGRPPAASRPHAAQRPASGHQWWVSSRSTPPLLTSRQHAGAGKASGCRWFGGRTQPHGSTESAVGAVEPRHCRRRQSSRAAGGAGGRAEPLAAPAVEPRHWRRRQRRRAVIGAGSGVVPAPMTTSVPGSRPGGAAARVGPLGRCAGSRQQVAGVRRGRSTGRPAGARGR
jgi:hypothetical protein